MLKTKSVKTGQYFAVVTNAKEGMVGSEKNRSAVRVYFEPKDKTGTVYNEKALCIFGNYEEYKQSAAYKFMDILGELEEKDIDCDRILQKAQGKKFVITIGEENGYKNIVDIRLAKKKKQNSPTVEEEP